MNVKLLRITTDPENIIAESARVCYASEPKTEGANQKLLRNLRDWGHMSTFEHASATFMIEDVSRALTHQLVRHRIASYSQQSQRYVNEQGFDYVTPPTIKANEQAQKIFDEGVEQTRKTYQKLIELGVPKEDARFMLPNACSTKIVMSMNFRELRHFIKIRGEKAAQWEIRDLAHKICEILKENAPNAFDDLSSDE